MRAALQGEAYECLPDASGMRIASCRTHEWAASDASGQHAWEAAQRQLSQAGTRVTLVETGHTFTIGYGGLTYIPEIGNENTLVLQQGLSECRVRFTRADRSGPKGLIGPLTCKVP